MNRAQKIKLIFPFIILFALLGLLWRELFYAKQSELPSALIGENVPAFALPSVLTEKIFTSNDLLGRVTLVNVFATWCSACVQELPMLMKIKEQYHVPIYGIDYKDKQEDVKKWLQQNGNPYALIGDDKKGDVAIDFGVYGTPETFIISPEGKILYRHVGGIDEETWEKVLFPLIKKYRR